MSLKHRHKAVVGFVALLGSLCTVPSATAAPACGTSQIDSVRSLNTATNDGIVIDLMYDSCTRQAWARGRYGNTTHGYDYVQIENSNNNGSFEWNDGRATWTTGRINDAGITARACGWSYGGPKKCTIWY